MGESEVFTRGEEIVAREIAGETLLVPIANDVADMQRLFALNTVGKFIWQHLDGRHTLADLYEEIHSVFDVGLSVAERDCREFLDRAMDAGLVGRT